MSTCEESTWIRATTGAPDWPCPRRVTRFAVEAGLERFHADPSDWTVTLDWNYQLQATLGNPRRGSSGRG